MDGSPVIRPILEDEIPQAAELIQAVITEQYDPAVYPRLMEQFAEGFLGAFDTEGKLQGVCIVIPVEDNAIRVLVLAVWPELRRLGIGRKLMDRTEDLARGYKKEKVTLEVRTINRGGLGFYTSLGYLVRKYLQAFYSDGSDAYYMEKMV